jgi:hypothetical protein
VQRPYLSAELPSRAWKRAQRPSNAGWVFGRPAARWGQVNVGAGARLERHALPSRPGGVRYRVTHGFMELYPRSNRLSHTPSLRPQGSQMKGPRPHTTWLYRYKRISTRGKPLITEVVSAALRKPAFSNSDFVPTYAIVSSTLRPRLSTGYPSITRAP